MPVVKPVVAKELSARIRALLRRSRPEPQLAAAIRSGSLEIRPEESAVHRDGRPVQLTVTEFRLLETLAERLGQVVSRQRLLERVWGYEYFGDTRLVDVHVSRLRRKVEEDPSSPRHVVTVRGLGYKLEP
jgi:DNA-binding response OmpR family regulator